MEKKKEIEITDTENYEGYYSAREHVLLLDPKKIKNYDAYMKAKKGKKIDPILLNLYMSL